MDPSVQLNVVESVVPPKLRTGRFKASDKLIAALHARSFTPSKTPAKSRKK
jgi:hypothetical protein